MTVWKYSLEGNQPGTPFVLTLPYDAPILTFQLDPRGSLCIWVRNNNLTPGPRKLVLMSTGQEMPEPAPYCQWYYRGTVVRGDYVCHLFEEG